MNNIWKCWLAAILSVSSYAVAGIADGQVDIQSRSLAQSQWRAEKKVDGIEVFSRPVANSSLRAVRVEADINATFDDTLSLLLDAEQRPQWDEICASASVYAQVSDKEDLVYIHNRLPWPVADRDMVLRRSLTVAEDGSSARIQTIAVDQVIPRVSGRIRVIKADAVWNIDRIGESSVRVSTEVHADPGGPIPDMLVNSLSIEGPYKALRNIRRLLEGSHVPSAH